MNPIKLPPAHRRSLSAVARSIEQSLNDIITLLGNNRSNATLHRIERSYSKTQRQEIIAAAKTILIVLQDLIKHFKLDTSTVTEGQILHAKCTHIWSLLHDSYSKKMKRYGELSKEAEVEIDSHIDKMLKLVSKLQHFIHTEDESDKE